MGRKKVSEAEREANKKRLLNALRGVVPFSEESIVRKILPATRVPRLDLKQLKTGVVTTLRKENERLEKENETLRTGLDTLETRQFVEDYHQRAVQAMYQVTRVLLRALPAGTKKGKAARVEVRQLFESAGLKKPTELRRPSSRIRQRGTTKS